MRLNEVRKWGLAFFVDKKVFFEGRGRYRSFLSRYFKLIERFIDFISFLAKQMPRKGFKKTKSRELQ